MVTLCHLPIVVSDRADVELIADWPNRQRPMAQYLFSANRARLGNTYTEKSAALKARLIDPSNGVFGYRPVPLQRPSESHFQAPREDVREGSGFLSNLHYGPHKRKSYASSSAKGDHLRAGKGRAVPL
jgi:hypothetical protein